MEYLGGGEIRWKDEYGNPTLKMDQTRRIFRDVTLGLEYRKRSVSPLVSYARSLPSQSTTRESFTETSNLRIFYGLLTDRLSRSQTLAFPTFPTLSTLPLLARTFPKRTSTRKKYSWMTPPCPRLLGHLPSMLQRSFQTTGTTLSPPIRCPTQLNQRLGGKSPKRLISGPWGSHFTVFFLAGFRSTLKTRANSRCTG